MNAGAVQVSAAARTASAAVSEGKSRIQLVATAAFAILTLGATVTVFATFLALVIGGAVGSRGLFALVAGSLAYAALVLVQFIHCAVFLLRTLRGRR